MGTAHFEAGRDVQELVKIGILSNLYPPMARGGAEQIASRVATELSRRGHDVFIVSTQLYDGLRSWHGRITERHAEVVYRYYPCNIYHLTRAAGFPFPLRALWHLLDLYCGIPAKTVGYILDDEKPDIVLTHNLKGMGLAVVRAIRDRHIPMIHTVHDVQLSVPSGLLIAGQENAFLNRSWIRTPFERAVQRVFGSPHAVVSPSRFLADFYRERGFFPASQWHVIPNPAPHVEPPPRGVRRDGPLRILFAGQLEEHKGVRLLLETLNASDLPFELHIAGEGALSDVVSGWAERDARITHHGFVSIGNLMNLLQICDVTVVPSLCYENSPTVIYESFLAGVPVVASNIGGIGELVEDGKTGLLFAPGSGDQLLASLRRMLTERDAFREREHEIRGRAAEYSLPRYVDQIEALMRNLG